MFGRALNTTLEAFGNILNEKDKTAILGQFHCVKRVRILVRIQPKCGKIRTRIFPNTDTFHAVSKESLMDSPV